MGWEAFRMENCQSWEDQTFVLDKGLTVIESKSEVGKSVFVKCIRLGLFHEEYTPRKRKSIIRNWHSPNPKPAKFTIQTDEGYLVQFTFSPTNITTTEISPDGEVRKYKGSADKQTKKILRLVTTGKRIMNILDNEAPMLLDGTDGKYNDSVLGDFTTHKELEAMHRTSEQNIMYYKDMLGKAQREVKNNNYKLSKIPMFGNLDWVRSNLDMIKDLDIKLKVIETMLPRLDRIITENKPKEIKVDLDGIADIGNYNKRLLKVINKLEAYFKEEVPLTGEIPGLILTKDSLVGIVNLIELITKDLIQEDSITIDLAELVDHNNKLKLVKKLLKTLITVYDVDKVKTISEKSKTETTRKMLELSSLALVVKKLHRHSDLIQEMKIENEKGLILLEARNYIYDELKVCPLCESTLRKVN